MKIEVFTNENQVRIKLPNAFIWAVIRSQRLKKHADLSVLNRISLRTRRKIKKAIKQYKRTHPSWSIVEVREADGTFTRISL